MQIGLAAIAVAMTAHGAAIDQSAIDFEAFLNRQDMLWDRIPNRWAVAPYTGNGNVGFLFYQAKGEAKNVISIYVGRHDYYDHRLPHEGQEMLWIYCSRLPLGHFNLESKGDITVVDLRLGLWNAEMTGTVKTSQGSYAVRGLSHSTTDGRVDVIWLFHLGMLCIPGVSSLSIEECHNILPCERTSTPLTEPDMKISLIRLFSMLHSNVNGQ